MTVSGEDPDRRVTVVVCCYNHERFVAPCLRSVLAQTHPPAQVVITDDGSTDASVAVCAAAVEHATPPIRTVRPPTNIGLPAILNRAMALVETPYVVVIAGDDLMEPQRLERQVAAFEALGDDVAVIYSDLHLVDAEGDRFPRTYFDGRHPPTGRVFVEGLRRCAVPAPSAMMRRNALSAVGPYDERFLSEDFDMFLRLSRDHRFGYVDEPLTSYRQLETSMSKSIPTRRFREDHIAALLKHVDVPDRRERAAVRRELERLIRNFYLEGRSPRATATDARHALRAGASPRLVALAVLGTLRLPGPAVQGGYARLRRLGPGGRRPSAVE